MNQEQLETKTFSLKVDKLFYEAMAQGEVFNQLKGQAYAYFGSASWQITEGAAKEEEGKITFTIQVSGRKGKIKQAKDEGKSEWTSWVWAAGK